MKNVLKTLALLIVTFAITSCDPNNGGDDNTKPEKNYYCIDSTYQEINSCVSYTSNNEAFLIFTSEDLSAVQFSFDNHNEIPVGTFELNEDDNCNYEGAFESINLSGDLIGVLSISVSEEIYTFTFEGQIVDDNISKAFSLSYQDKVIDANKNTGEGTLTINDVSYSLKRGACTHQSFEGLMNLYALVLASGNENDIEDYCVATLGFLGKTSIPVGTFPIAEIPMMGPIFIVEINDQELIGISGEVTIAKNEETYSITANGTFKQEDIREDINFTLTYEGDFITFMK